MTVGEQLKQARLEKGISLIEIQEKVKLPIQHLEAIENDDYDALGSDYNVKMIIRSYANLLGLNAEALIRQYETGEEIEVDESEEVIESRQSRVAPKKTKPKKFNKIIPISILAFVFLLIVGSVGYAFVKENKRFNANTSVNKNYEVEDHANDAQEEPKEEAVTSSEAPQEQVSSSSEEKKEEMKIETVSNTGSQVTMKATNVEGSQDLVLTGKNGRCWVNVVAGGQTLYQGIVEANAKQKVTIPDQTSQITIKTGNAPALEMSLGGKTLDFKANTTLKQVNVSLSLEYVK